MDRLPFQKNKRARDPHALRFYKQTHPVCEACARRRSDEIHHLVSRKMGGSDVPENLLALCGGRQGCHFGWTGVNRTRCEWFRQHEATMTEEARAKVRRALRLEEEE